MRTLIIYLLLFSATAYGVHRGLLTYYADQLPPQVEIHDDTMSFVVPAFNVPPRETEAGLILSGFVAQNRRDWNQAWQDFSALHSKYSDDPEFALRAFTLALGNGDFLKAEELAANLVKIDSETTETDRSPSGDKFDLARLFIILTLVKDETYNKALSELDSMVDGPLAGFSKPILENWIKAVISPEALTDSSEGLNPLQILYKAYAAEYAGRDDIALTLMDQVDMRLMTPDKMEMIAAFYTRMGQEDKAQALVRQHMAGAGGNEGLALLHSRLEQGAMDVTVADSEERSFKTPQQAIAQAYFDFSQAMLSEGAVDSALLFARMGIYLNPEMDGVYMTAAEILKYQGQDDQALQAYAKVDVTDDAYEQAIAEQVSILGDKDQWERAETTVRDALENLRQAGKTESAYLYFLLGNSLQEQKDYDAALEAYNTAERLGLEQGNGEELPRSLWPLYYTRAVIYDVTDQWEKAEADLKHLLRLTPENPLVLNYLGYSYADKNINLDKAKDMISRAVMAAPNDAYIIDSMGWILYRMGDYDEAVKMLERAASLAPYHMVVNDHLGDAYWKVGRKLEAYYMWRRAADYYDPSNEEQRRMIDETRRKLKEGLE